MALTFDDIEYMNSHLESTVFDRKSVGILSHANDLADLMVAFGNNKFVSEDFGGIIVIGINDNGSFEELEPDQGHEEMIMNVAQQKIIPPMTPTFEVVSDGTRNVYAITIPKMTTTPYGLKTSEGIVYKKRVGSTNRSVGYDELKLLEKDSDDSESKEKRINSSFPKSTTIPFIKITVIPINVNSQMINFDKENTEWLKSIPPKNLHFTTRTLQQNEIHYQSRTFPNPDSDLVVINQFGEITAMEFLRVIQGDTIHIGRQAVILLSILNYVKNVYKKFKYSGTISVKVELGNVVGLDFRNTEHEEDYWYTEKQFTINPIPITRIISIDLINIKSLVTSIIAEICRACDWTIDEPQFQKYLARLIIRLNSQ